VAEAGLGRVAIHFDRNTFFNANGAGTSLHRFDNARYAKNLFEWLAGRSFGRPQVQAEDFRYDQSPQTLRIAFNRYVARSLSTADIKLINRKTGAVVAATSETFESSSNTGIFKFSRTLSTGNYRVTLFAREVTDS